MDTGKPVDVPVGETLPRTCIGCGDGFQWTSRPGFQWPGEYCSPQCRRRTRRRNREERRVQLDDPGAAADGMLLLICARCAHWFGWTPPRQRFDWEGPPSPPLYHTSSCKEKAKEDRKKGLWAAREETRRQRIATAEGEARRRAEEARAARVAEASAAARALLLPAANCQACGKVASPTREEAKRAKREIEARTGRADEVRYYKCPAGWWHWTRMDATLDGWRARQGR